MSKEPTTTILWFTQTNNEWTAWSAVGSLAAALVAVGLPFLIGFLGWLRRRREQRERYREVVAAVYRALELFREALDYDWKQRNVATELRPLQARARYQAQTLGLLAQGGGISDGAVDCLLACAMAMAKLDEAADRLRAGSMEAAETILADACFIIANPEQRIGGVERTRLGQARHHAPLPYENVIEEIGAKAARQGAINARYGGRRVQPQIE